MTTLIIRPMVPRAPPSSLHGSTKSICWLSFSNPRDRSWLLMYRDAVCRFSKSPIVGAGAVVVVSTVAARRGVSTESSTINGLGSGDFPVSRPWDGGVPCSCTASAVFWLSQSLPGTPLAKVNTSPAHRSRQPPTCINSTKLEKSTTVALTRLADNSISSRNSSYPTS